MKTAKLTRYRLRWRQQRHVPLWRLYFGDAVVAQVDQIGETWRAHLYPSAKFDSSEIAYEGPSLPQAKRTAKQFIRLCMCREVDEQKVVGTRVKRGRIKR